MHLIREPATSIQYQPIKLWLLHLHVDFSFTNALSSAYNKINYDRRCMLMSLHMSLKTVKHVHRHLDL